MFRQRIFYRTGPLYRKYAVVLAFGLVSAMVVIGLAVPAKRDGQQQQFAYATNAKGNTDAEPASANNPLSVMVCIKKVVPPNGTLLPDEICGRPGPDVGFANYGP